MMIMASGSVVQSGPYKNNPVTVKLASKAVLAVLISFALAISKRYSKYLT